MTPEGRVKGAVKDLLNQYRPALYQHWPVQNGMGSPTLDCNGAYCGQAFSVETKAPGKKPTPRQAQTIQAMKLAGIAVFVVDGELTLLPLRCWLEEIKGLKL